MLVMFEGVVYCFILPYLPLWRFVGHVDCTPIINKLFRVKCFINLIIKAIKNTFVIILTYIIAKSPEKSFTKPILIMS